MRESEAPQSELNVAVAGKVGLVIPARPEFVAISRLAVSGLGHMARLDEESIADLKLAVTEACAHAIGGGAYSEDRLHVDLDIGPSEWAIDVWLSRGRSDVASPLADFGPDDLGLLIMRSLLDEVTLEGRGPSGRVIHLRKRV